MDILKLDPQTYLPSEIVESYSTKIWTERYSTSGEFELHSEKIDKSMSILPEGSLITLRDSDEVMIVENHSINTSGNKKELVSTGRTFESFTENRALVAEEYRTPWETIQQYTTRDVIALVLWNAVANVTGQDPSRFDWSTDVKDAVANVVITDSTTLSDILQNWWLEEKDVYTSVNDFLSLIDIGLRNIRPSYPNYKAGKVVSFDTSPAPSRGTVQKVTTPAISQLRMDIYNGADRTRYQDVLPQVIFHYAAKHIESPNYLFSIKDYKTMGVVTSSIGTVNVYPTSPIIDPTNLSGMNRRVLLIDGGDIGDLDYNEFLEAIVQKGQIELQKHNRKILYDGSISPTSPYRYGLDYFLGDKVTLLAEYGFEASMTVAEYVRTEDQAGDRGYPTLVISK